MPVHPARRYSVAIYKLKHYLAKEISKWGVK